MKNIYLIISILRLSLSRSLEINLNADNGFVLQPNMDKDIYSMISSNARGFRNGFVGEAYYANPMIHADRKLDENIYSNQQMLQSYEGTNKFENFPVNQVRDSSRSEIQNLDNSNEILSNHIMQHIADQFEVGTRSNNMGNEQSLKNNVNEIEKIGEKIEEILSKSISNRGNMNMNLQYENLNPNYIMTATQKEPVIQNGFVQNNDIQIEGKNLNHGKLIEQPSSLPLQYTNENSGYLPPINQEYLPPPQPEQNQLLINIQPNNMFNTIQNSYGAIPQQPITEFKNNMQELGMKKNVYYQPDKLRIALLSENLPQSRLNSQNHDSNMLNQQPIQIPRQMFNNKYNNIRPMVNSQPLDTTFPQNQYQNNLLHEPLDNLKPQTYSDFKKPSVQTSIYSYAPPEETEEDQQAEIQELGQKNINYKVIFIRAPHQITKNTLQLAKTLNNEQTVIYVLSKKTDPNEIREAIDAIPKPTIKPEVHFVKYKTNEEAIYAQNQIQAQYNSLGGTTTVNREEIAPIHIVNNSVSSLGPY